MTHIFISIPLKKTKEVDVTNSLKNFISSNISTSDKPQDCTKEIAEFNKLRNNAVCRNIEKNESSLETLYRYYDQLEAMDTKMPFDEAHVPIAFKWKVAFDTSLFNYKSSLTMVSGQFEKACVLFNISALQSAIAASQNLDQDANLKLAVRYFQMAAGTLANLKEKYISNGRIQNDTLTLDLSIECLDALYYLMLAQAQELFVKKAKEDNKKPLVIAKLAEQAAEFYADTLKHMSSPTLKGFFDKEFINTVTCKRDLLNGLAQYFAGLDAQTDKRFGEAISRFNYAVECIKMAQKVAPSTNYIQQTVWEKLYKDPSLGTTIEMTYAKAHKENDFIYHERIAKPAELEPIPKATLAKPIEPAYPLSGRHEFRDLFQKIVPIPVNQALVIYETRKADLVNSNIARLRQATQNLNSFLVAMNLPASLEDITGVEISGSHSNTAVGKVGGLIGSFISDYTGVGNKRIPRSLLNKSNAIKKVGGIVALTKPMSELPVLLQRNKDILAEALRILDDEKETDIELRKRFGSKWVRTPSEKLQTPLREEARKYNQIIEAAVQADEIVKNKFEQHRKIIELLCEPENEIAKNIPSSVGALSSDLPVVKELKELMEKVETLKAERETIEFEFQQKNNVGPASTNNTTASKHDNTFAQDTTDAINQKFMKVFTTQGKINEKEISDDILQASFGDLEKQTKESLNAQDNLIERIQVANLAFVQEKSKDPNFDAKRRDKFLQELASASDTFTELCANLKEGIKFYNDLTPILLKFQNKCSDLCFARKTERDELMKDMQDSIVNQPAHAYVSPYETNATNKLNTTSPDSAGPPSRPPPPSFSTPNNTIQPSQAPLFQAQPSNFNVNPSAPTNYMMAHQQPLAPTVMPLGFNPFSYQPQTTYPMQYPYGNAMPYPNQPPMNMPYQGFPIPPNVPQPTQPYFH